VRGLGTFVEIEAIGTDENADADALQAQCRRYMMLFGLSDGSLVPNSYSDLLSR